MRKAMRRRRRMALIATCICVSAASGGFFALVGLTSDDIVRAAVAQSKSLADLLDARSPGARTAAQLTKTKHARSLPKQHMAPRHTPAPPDLAHLLTPSAAEPVSFAGAASFVRAAPSLATIVGPLPGGEVIPPSREIIQPGGGGGGGVIPPGGGPPLVSVPTPQPRNLVPPPALPEPGTWASMLLGFAFIGWRVRRRSRAEVPGQPT